MLFEYPTKEEWNEIYKSYPFEKLIINREDYLIDGKGIENPIMYHTTSPWVNYLFGRLFEIKKSFVFMKYYFNKGITDDEWMKSGDDGGIKYFTKSMTNRQRLILIEFCYYVDVFYYKIFSAFDSLGHLLNEMFALELIDNNVNFKSAIKKLKNKNKDLYAELNKIRGNKEFIKANNLRNDFTHNFSPCEIGPGYKKHIKIKNSYWLSIKLNLNNILDKLTFGQIRFVTRREDNHSVKGISFGGGDYVCSKDIIKNATKILDLLAETLDIIKSNAKNHQPKTINDKP